MNNNHCVERRREVLGRRPSRGVFSTIDYIILFSIRWLYWRDFTKQSQAQLSSGSHQSFKQQTTMINTKQLIVIIQDLMKNVVLS